MDVVKYRRLNVFHIVSVITTQPKTFHFTVPFLVGLVSCCGFSI